jgi:hypothetical protein
MRLVMFTPREQALERGWPGRIDGDRVVQLAAQTLESFFTGGGGVREHAEYALVDVALRAPVLRPPSIRFFADERSFAFGNTASIHGPEDEVTPPAEVESRFCVAAVIGAEEQIGGFMLANDWRAPSLEPPKDRDFATTVGPWIETEHAGEGFRWEAARALAALNTALRPGDVLVGPPFAVGVAEAAAAGLGTLQARIRVQARRTVFREG